VSNERQFLAQTGAPVDGNGNGNGKIKLSWGQIVWGIAMLMALAASWYDMRSQIASVRYDNSLQLSNLRAEVSALRVELAFRSQVIDQSTGNLDRRVDRLEGRR